MSSSRIENIDELEQGGIETDWPFISIVMPIRNEAAFIAQNLNQLLAQDYPTDKFEIIVADGMSTDRTPAIVHEFESRDGRVRLIDNPNKIVSTGLNAAIRHARGEIVIRVDGHVTVAPDFIRSSVRLLRNHPDAWAGGGPIVHAGTNLFGKAVAAAMSHPVGMGNATHRFADYEGYGEGAAFPAIHRWVFDRVGYFDESLVRNQDDEFNHRVAMAGGKIFISPSVKYVYFVRDSVRKLARQFFQYSFWRIPVMKKHRRPTTVRQVVPLAFFIVLVALLIVGVSIRNPWIAFSLPAAYVAVLLLVGLSMIPRHGIRVALLVPIALATMHLSYAAGMLYGLIAGIAIPNAWSHDSSMSKLSR